MTNPKTIIAFLIGLSAVLAQSPGPDYPNCLRTSSPQGHHPGWEVLNMVYYPPQREYVDKPSWLRLPYLGLDLVNWADGSRIVCSLFGNDTADHVVLTNEDGNACRSALVADKWESIQERDWEGAGVPVPEVRFDTRSRELFINQTWECRGEDGETVSFSGAATGVPDFQCAFGRDDNIERCSPESLFITTEPVVVHGPATVVQPSALIPAFPTGDDLCETSTAGWQMLSLGYSPPREVPPRGPITPGWRSDMQIELRNLADESRTLCHFVGRGGSGEQLLLSNRGMSNMTIEDGAINGCHTSRLRLVMPDGLPTGEARRAQEWEWVDTAQVEFDTETGVLSINQTWTCLGKDGSHSNLVKAMVESKLELNCKTTVAWGSYEEQRCGGLPYTFNNSTGPVLVGPSTITSF